MRIVFLGTPDFAVESLKILVENNLNIVGVITSPDKPAGRGYQLKESAVKKYARSAGLNILQPKNLKDKSFIQELRNLKADLQIVVAFRMLPEVVWNMPSFGTFNLHASLLPNYRGAAPINWAIINGETETGVTTFFLKHEIDTGDILLQEKVAIGNKETVGELYVRLMEIGAKLSLKTVQMIQSGNVNPLPQSKISTSLKDAPKLNKQNTKIDWRKSAEEIRNHIRGLNPFPVAWTEFKNQNGKVLSCKIYNSDSSEDEINTIQISKKAFQIPCGKGSLYIKELQLAGKKRMFIEDFLRGFDKTQNWIPKN